MRDSISVELIALIVTTVLRAQELHQCELELPRHHGLPVMIVSLDVSICNDEIYHKENRPDWRPLRPLYRHERREKQHEERCKSDWLLELRIAEQGLDSPRWSSKIHS